MPPLRKGTMQNIFDTGRRVHSGGYAFPLSGWREYYTLNVLGTHAITHEQFCKEFPEAADALRESDAQQAQLQKFLSNEKAMTALIEVVKHLDAGKPVELLEGDGTPAEHVHQYNAPGGNGETDVVNGHKHAIQGGKCMEADGHSHDMPGAGDAGEADKPAGDAAAKEGE